MTEKLKPPKFVTCEARLTFVHLAQPDPKLSKLGTQKYSVCALIPKSDQAGIKKLQDYINESIELCKPFWGGKLPANFNTPLKDGNVERAKYPEFQDVMYFNSGTKFRPPIYNLERHEIPDPTAVYSGMYGKLCVIAFPYSYSGKHGISLGLESVQKTRDGELLIKRSSPADVFVDEPEDILA